MNRMIAEYVKVIVRNTNITLRTQICLSKQLSFLLTFSDSKLTRTLT